MIFIIFPLSSGSAVLLRNKLRSYFLKKSRGMGRGMGRTHLLQSFPSEVVEPDQRVEAVRVALRTGVKVRPVSGGGGGGGGRVSVSSQHGHQQLLRTIQKGEGR